MIQRGFNYDVLGTTPICRYQIYHETIVSTAWDSLAKHED